MGQHVQSECGVCAGAGTIYKHKEKKEVLEVHVQKGAPDGHRITFPGKADELPHTDTGDVVFTLKEKDHKYFKRRGADLFVERTISLSEALCGFQLELTHLDGRKLLIKSAPGDIVKPMAQGFDPLAQEEQKNEWEVMEDCD